MTELDLYIIKKVREFRIDKGMSQKEFGDNIDLSQGLYGIVKVPKNVLNIILITSMKFVKFLIVNSQTFFLMILCRLYEVIQREL